MEDLMSKDKSSDVSADASADAQARIISEYLRQISKSIVHTPSYQHSIK